MTMYICIVHRGLPDMTQRCLDSLKLTRDCRIYLVDNGGGCRFDETEKVKASVVKRKPVNIGVIWNDMLEMIMPDDYLVLLHNDTEVVSENWLTEMRLAYDFFEDCGVVLTRSSIGGCAQEQWATNVTNFRFSSVERANMYLKGYCMMLSYDVRQTVGRFNEELRIMTDREYFARVVASQRRLVIANNAIVDHLGGATHNEILNLSDYRDAFAADVSLIGR